MSPQLEDIEVPAGSLERIRSYHWDICGVQFCPEDYEMIYKIVAADIKATATAKEETPQ